MNTCHWCGKDVTPSPHNLVHVGGQGDVYACDRYLHGEDCRTAIQTQDWNCPLEFTRMAMNCTDCTFKNECKEMKAR